MSFCGSSSVLLTHEIMDFFPSLCGFGLLLHITFLNGALPLTPFSLLMMQQKDRFMLVVNFRGAVLLG